MDHLRTPRLLLRRARPTDLADLHAVLSDARAMRYWATPPHASFEETRAWLDDMIATPAGVRDDFVIEYEGRAVGKAGCWRVPEIGFILRPDLWRRGLAREALSAVIPHLFEAHPIPAVTADVDPRNRASLALLASLGFQETGRASGTCRVGDELCDSVYLALPRP